MAKQNKAQQDTIGRVMHEFKHGELDRGQGGKVRNPKQAIAIALSEAGASNRQSPATNKRRLADTKRKEQAAPRRDGGPTRAAPTRAALYDEATRRGIAGRSRMGKAELQKALQAAE